MVTANKNAVAKTDSKTTAVAVQDDIPDFMKHSGPARGSENVGAEDLVIPRLELVQSLSPCLDESDAAYIEGSKAGMLYNNVTRELYGSSVVVIPVFFKKEFIVWKDRKKGGGFVGAFSTMEAAEEARAGLENPDEHQINDTANHFCLMVNPNSGRVEEIVVSMAVTKLKISRQWNSLVRINGGDSFSRQYTLGTAIETNKNNEKYHNFSIKANGFVTQEQWERAETLYEAVKSGIATVNRDEEPAPDSGGMRDLNEKTEY